MLDETMAEPGEIVPELKIDYSEYDKLHKTKSSVEEIVTKMISVKNDGSPKSHLPDLVAHIFLNFVTLRKANRTILLQEDRLKAETERAKAPADFTTLQLHNLMYEKNHYVKAIKACKDFRSKYPDIELVPEEEFFRDAPEDIKSSVISSDCNHNLMLKRLNFELFQRKELCKLREKLEQQKRILQDTISDKKKFLSSLPSHLKSLKKASLPVQNQLGVLYTKKLKQHQSAELLPPPLYVIYSQLMAQKEAFGEVIDLEIIGSVKDAQAFARKLAVKDTEKGTCLESSSFEDDVPDEEDDGQRRRKRTKKLLNKEIHDPTGVREAPHPLKVILHIYDDEASDSKLITLRFEYLTKLNVVCVGVEDSEGPNSNILCNLFPDDTGLELPHQSDKLYGDALASDERSNRPYKWAQHLAGIDFLPDMPPLLNGSETSNSETARSGAFISGISLFRQQNRAQTVVRRIRSRRKAQLDLVEQLDCLMKLKWPDLTCKSVPWASHTPQCCLHSCLPAVSAPNQSSTLPVFDIEPLQHGLDMAMEERSGPPKEVVENIREDGELPSLLPVLTGVNDTKLTPLRGSNSEHSRKIALMSKNIISPVNKEKLQSFKKYEDDGDLMLDSDSELDEPAIADQGGPDTVCKSWADFGVKEYVLVLARKCNNDKIDMKLESKILISTEYPLRPPLFELSLQAKSHEDSFSELDSSEWYNELRAMEAEVNVHIMKAMPMDQENWILTHQVLCLAMLFDFYIDHTEISDKGKTTCVVDVGLCKPVSGGLAWRSFRGRDHRKMISWKDSICTPGYPC